MKLNMNLFMKLIHGLVSSTLNIIERRCLKVGAILERLFIATDQMVSATDASKKFKEIRQKAKEEPQYIFDRGNIDSVLVDFTQFEKMVLRLQELEEEILMLNVANRLEEYEKDPSTGIPWAQIRRTKKILITPNWPDVRRSNFVNPVCGLFFELPAKRWKY
jgi:PHD/YefM family antitoxin component YafN of YafNO toxin-antitoxin module